MQKLFITLLLIVPVAIAAQSGDIATRINLVENNLIPYAPVKGFKGWNIIDRMQHYKVPGLSIAVIKDYRIDWAKAYGLADTTKKIPVTTNTLFSAGSISKLLMAVTALQLCEEGKLFLDSPVNNYLRSWKIEENDFTRKTPVTLRMLLSHTGGTTQSAYFGFTPDKNPLPTIIDILNGEKVAETRKVVVNSEPGKEFRYSGGGSMIAQMAIMDVTRQTFTSITQRLLFDKLGMKNSTFAQPLPPKYNSHAAWPYSQAPWFKGVPYVYPQQAAAGLYTTPTDLAKFFIDLQQSLVGKGIILGKQTVQNMMTPQANVADGGYKEQIGTGPFLLQRTDNHDPDGVYFEFTGVNAGFLAYGIGSVKDGNGVIIMLNSGDNQNGIGKEIRRSVAKTYHWKNFLPDEIVPVSLQDMELDRLTGRYRMGENEVVYIKKEKNYLVETINDGDTIYCFPIAKDTIIFTDFNVKGTFKLDSTGKAISLQTAFQEKPMPKMRDDEFTPNEYIAQKKYTEAKAAFSKMNLGAYQITYIAYDLLNKRPFDAQAVKAVLELAEGKYPDAAIVFNRWGDYYLKINDRQNAILSYQKSLSIDPSDEQVKEALQKLNR